MKVKRLPNVSKGMKQLELSDMASRNTKWYRHFATIWYFLTCLKIQLLFPQKYGSWVFSQNKWKHMFIWKLVNVCTWNLYLQQPKMINDPIVFQLMDEFLILSFLTMKCYPITKKTRVWGDGSVEYLLYKNKELSLIPRTHVLIKKQTQHPRKLL